MDDQQKYAKLQEMVRTVIAGYEAWNIEAIMAPRSADCTYHILPQSMKRPPMDNTQFREYYAGVLPYMKNFHVKIWNTVVDTRANSVAVYGTTTAESVLGPYESDQSIFFKMTPDCSQVCEIKEFFDTAHLQGVFVALTKYIEEGGKPITEQ